MKKSVAIIGGGTAGLLAASFLDTELYDVTIYDKKSSVGRKFLVAGDGGFNLTHSEDITAFTKRFTPYTFLEGALQSFTNKDFVTWLRTINIDTYIGSSKRVFPKQGIKPIQVLKAITNHLDSRGINFAFKKEFTGWDKKGAVVFNAEDKVHADYYVFAVGGGSWKITGSDGSWLKLFKEKGIAVVPFKASNCAFKVDWSLDFINVHEGKPLKNISLFIEDYSCKGEIVLTRFGIEGNAIYALSKNVQAAFAENDKAVVYLDHKPTLSKEVVLEKLNKSKWNTSKTLREVLKLSGAQVSLIKEGLTKDEYLDHETLALAIKKMPLLLTAASPIDEAISTAGGVHVKGLSSSFELLELENTFTIGEMVDWNTRTGGYLIQGCVSMGVMVARYLNKKL